MQTPTTQPQPAPAPPPPPVQAPVPSITIVGPDGATQTLTIPATRAEVEALLAQREELSEQLSSVTSRRNELSSSIPSAPVGASRTGIEERIRVLDQRILQLETDLAVTGRKLSSAPAELGSSAGVQTSGGDNFEAGFAAGGFFVLFFASLVLLYARRKWKRSAALPARVPAESALRLERLEQGVEAIAIEIERVSEGQRFVTKLLSESPSPLGASHRIPQPATVENDRPS